MENFNKLVEETLKIAEDIFKKRDDALLQYHDDIINGKFSSYDDAMIKYKEIQRSAFQEFKDWAKKKEEEILGKNSSLSEKLFICYQVGACNKSLKSLSDKDFIGIPGGNEDFQKVKDGEKSYRDLFENYRDITLERINLESKTIKKLPQKELESEYAKKCTYDEISIIDELEFKRTVEDIFSEHKQNITRNSELSKLRLT